MDEFSLINKYIQPLVEKNKEALSLLDDVAIISNSSSNSYSLVTTDCVIEGVHFFKDENPYSIAYRLMISNLSDLATKGGIPKFFTLTLCPRNIKELTHNWLKTFFNAIQDIQSQYHVKLIGGNTASSNSSLFISVTLIGDIPPVTNKSNLPFRFKAKVNDSVYISKCIGDSYLGYNVIASKKGLIDKPYWLNILSKKEIDCLSNCYYYPQISLSLGRDLVGIANAMTDASDGMVVTIHNICTSSNKQAEIKFYPYMFSKIAQKILNAYPKLMPEIFPALINWGGDYNLVFSVSNKKLKLLDKLIIKYKKKGINISNIGKITAINNSDTLKIKDFYNKEINMNIKKYIHK